MDWVTHGNSFQRVKRSKLKKNQNFFNYPCPFPTIPNIVNIKNKRCLAYLLHCFKNSLSRSANMRGVRARSAPFISTFLIHNSVWFIPRTCPFPIMIQFGGQINISLYKKYCLLFELAVTSRGLCSSIQSFSLEANSIIFSDKIPW